MPKVLVRAILYEDGHYEWVWHCPCDGQGDMPFQSWPLAYGPALSHINLLHTPKYRAMECEA